MAVLPALPLIRCMVCTYAVLGEVFSYPSGPFSVSHCLISGWPIAIVRYNRVCFPAYLILYQGLFLKSLAEHVCSFHIPYPPGSRTEYESFCLSEQGVNFFVHHIYCLAQHILFPTAYLLFHTGGHDLPDPFLHNPALSIGGKSVPLCLNIKSLLKTSEINFPDYS